MMVARWGPPSPRRRTETEAINETTETRGRSQTGKGQQGTQKRDLRIFTVCLISDYVVKLNGSFSLLVFLKA